MPIDRAAAKGDGHRTIRRRGAYKHVLKGICERDAMAAATSYLLLDDAETGEDLLVRLAQDTGVGACER